jgi:hypothetical protein
MQSKLISKLSNKRISASAASTVDIAPARMMDNKTEIGSNQQNIC